MKVFYLTYSIRGKSGIERIIVTKANYFSEFYNYDVSIITIDDYFEKPFYPIHKSVTHYDLKLRDKSFFSKSKHVSTVLKKQKPDVVLVAMDNFATAFLPLFIKKTFPMVLERHNIIINDFGMEKTLISKIKNRTKLFFMRLGVKSYDKLVILSEGGLKEWGNLKNGTIINNPTTFYPKEKSTLKNKTVLAVGRYNYQKGFDLLLKIWQKVSKEFPEWQLKIYGDGMEKSNLEKMVIKLGLTETVNLCAPTKNIEKIYLDSSIFTLPSRYEGFGLVLLEAMSCGIPVVSFDCPNGPSDIISDKQDGFLIPPNDLDAFAEKISVLIESTELRQKMGCNGRENIARLSPKTIMTQWNILLEKLIIHY